MVCLIDIEITHNRHELYMGHTQTLEVVQFFNKGREGPKTTVEFAIQGAVRGEITNICFIDNGIFPALEILNFSKIQILWTKFTRINKGSLGCFDVSLNHIIIPFC